MVELFRRWRSGDEDRRDGRPVVVLIHGLFGSADNLGMIARGLPEAYRVLSVDLRGHGRSPHARPISYPDMAGDMWAVLDAENVDRAILFGHSMGGKVAMQMALEQPERVAALMVGDIAPVRYPHSNHDRVLDAQVELRKDAPETRQSATEFMDGRLSDPGVAPFIMTNWRRGEAGWGWRHDLDGIIADYAQIADAPRAGDGAQYAGPALFISGGLSDYVQPAYQEQILSLFPAARAQVIAGTGHWFHAEKTEQTLRIISRFLEQLD